MSDTPTRPGFYWAKWKIAAPGTAEGVELTPSKKWEVVELWENFTGPIRCEADREIERYMVSVPGVGQSQAPDCFYWGPGPLVEPGSEVRP